MKLLHIAHRGEAQEFLKNLDLVSHPKLNGLYTNKTFALLIAGEGIYETLTKLPFIINLLNIDEILNFGIAGSLDSKLMIGSIIPVRTSYAHGELTPKFKSFTTLESSTIDCITTEERVLDDSFAKKLSPFAQIVDRELWAVGLVAKQFNIPFNSYKLISDFAGKSTDCFEIKNKALEYSEALFEYFLQIEQKEILQDIIYTPPMPMSFSNKIRYQKLIAKIIDNEELTHEEVLLKVNLKEILDLKVRSKEHSKILLQRLEEIQNPINTKVFNRLETLFKPFTDIGGRVKYDQTLETKKFTLSIEVNSQKNLDNIKRSIDIFDYKKLDKLWNGELDV